MIYYDGIYNKYIKVIAYLVILTSEQKITFLITGNSDNMIHNNIIY